MSNATCLGIRFQEARATALFYFRLDIVLFGRRRSNVAALELGVPTVFQKQTSDKAQKMVSAARNSGTRVRYHAGELSRAD
jgi:hypothetical protein